MITEFQRQPITDPDARIGAREADHWKAPALPVLGAAPQPTSAGAIGEPSMRRPAAAGLRDLTFASALATAADRLLGAPNVTDLWARVVVEAVSLIPADAAALIEWRERKWQVLATRPSDASPGANATEDDVAVIERHGLLDKTRGALELSTLASHKLDLRNFDSRNFDSRNFDSRKVRSHDHPWWSEVLIGRLAGLSRRHPSRLVWLAQSPARLSVSTGVAAIFLRHVDAAVQSVHARDTLQRAVAARHHIGLAQGVLMSRHQLTAEQAFAWLNQRSQDANVKLRLVADQVIAEGDLPDRSSSIHRTRPGGTP